MQGGPADELLGVAVERPALDQLVEVGRTPEDGIEAGLAGDDREEVTWTRSTRPAAMSARFIDRLPWERSGTSDSSLSRATTSTASPFTTFAFGPGGAVAVEGREDVEGVGRGHGALLEDG